MKPSPDAKKLFANLNFRLDYFLVISALLLIAIGTMGIAMRKPVKPIPTLVFTHWWQGDLGGGVLEGLAAEYEESRENIKIVLNPRSYEEVRKLLFEYKVAEMAETAGTPAEQTASANPGDILALDQLWVSDLYKNDLLDPSVPPSEPLISFFYPFFYNIDVLRNAGFLRPPRNRTELLNYAAAVTDPGSGRYGLGIALGEQNSRGVYQEIYPWFWASGVSLIAGGRAFTDTFDFFSRLHSGNAMHPQSQFWGEREKREAFINSRIAFMISPLGDIDFLRREMGDDAFSISVLPAADAYLGKPVFGAADWSLGIFKGSPYQKEAEEFIAFLIEKSPFLAEKAHVVTDGHNDDLLYSKAWEIYIAADLVKEFSEDTPPGLQKLSGLERDTIFREELMELFEETHTPASAANAVREKWGL